MTYKKTSLLLICFFSGVLFAGDISVEDKYFVKYKNMSDSDKVELLDALADDCNSRVLSSPTTNYLFFEVHENDMNKQKLKDLRDNGKIEKYKKQILREDSGSKYVITEDYAPLPEDWYEVHTSS